MPSFLPKAKPVLPPLPDVRETFSDERYAATVARVVKFVAEMEAKYSDRSYERITRPNTVTEALLLEMSTIAAYAAEVELVTAIRDHAEGKISDESIKVYLRKYIDTHTFRFEADRYGYRIRQVYKSGPSSRTGDEIPLFYVHRGIKDLNDAYVCNVIQVFFRQAIAKLRGHASYSVSRL